MSIGRTLAECRHERELSQEQLALDLPISKELLGKIEIGKRRLQKDVMPFVASELDHVKATTVIWKEATGVSVPYFDGDYIDHTPAALIMLALKEIEEAERDLQEVNAYKPAQAMSLEEVEVLRKANRQLLDVAAAAITLVGDNCEWHGLSFQDEMKNWEVTLKARRYIK